jgi:hypothetical protein
MILLVVGLVAVIVVVLIAVFLSIRLGRGDEDDEPDLRSSGRDRRRDQDERWRDTPRVPVSGSRGGRSDYPGYSSRGPAGGRAPRGRDYDSAPQRPVREGSDYGAGSSPRRASPSPHRPTQATQATQKPAAARSAVGASAQARGRSGNGSRRPAADDFPSADYPSMDFGPGDSFATGDQPSVEFPAAVDDSRGRPERRKPASAPASSKSRSRQRGKRDDDDDWPSSEWDKLSDEQYWAELSADKPLSSTARPSRPASNAAKAPANGSASPSPHHPTQAKAKPVARDSRPARPPASDRDMQRDLPSRQERTEQREPATERLPVRAARQAPPSLPPSRREADTLAASRSFPEPRSVLDSGPRPSRETGPHQARSTGPHPAMDTGSQPSPGHRRRDTTGPQPTRDPDLAMLTGLASAPPPIPGALQDDPLTSPSFSLKAVPASDSRSYSNARKHAKPAADHSANGAAPANGNGHGANGHSSGGYPVADYADPGYAYHSAPPAAPAAADWYSAPPAPAAMPAETPAPAYGDPYAHTGSGNGATGAHAAGQATAAYNNYLADPLRVYSPPGYEAPAPYAEPASPAGYMPAPLPPAGAQPYPDQSGYQDGYGTGGYASGYEAGYSGDPYASGGYVPYPPQG